MSHLSFPYKGYGVYLAAVQPSKRARGGHTRSMQIIKDNRIVKQIRYDIKDPYGYAKASKKACKFIDKKLANDAITTKIKEERDNLIHKASSGAQLSAIEQTKLECILSVTRNMINHGLMTIKKTL